MDEQLYSAILSKQKLDELLDRASITDPKAREVEWQTVKEFFLFEVMKLVVGKIGDGERKKLGEGLNHEAEEDRKKYYQRVNEYINAKKLSGEVMKEILKEAAVAAYNDYSDKIKNSNG